MRLFALVLTALVSVGCSSVEVSTGRKAAALAPPAQVAQVATTPIERRSGRVDVVAEGAPLGDVLDRIGRQVGWNLVCEPQAGRLPVTIRLFDLPWRDALELLLARGRCEATPAGENTLYVTEPVRITIQF